MKAASCIHFATERYVAMNAARGFSLGEGWWLRFTQAAQSVPAVFAELPIVHVEFCDLPFPEADIYGAVRVKLKEQDV